MRRDGPANRSHQPLPISAASSGMASTTLGPTAVGTTEHVVEPALTRRDWYSSAVLSRAPGAITSMCRSTHFPRKGSLPGGNTNSTSRSREVDGMTRRQFFRIATHRSSSQSCRTCFSRGGAPHGKLVGALFTRRESRGRAGARTPSRRLARAHRSWHRDWRGGARSWEPRPRASPRFPCFGARPRVAGGPAPRDA